MKASGNQASSQRGRCHTPAPCSARLVVQSSVGKFAIVRFTGRLFATILPVLDHFTVEAAVVGGVPVPWEYLGWAAVYAALYSAVAILVALVLFQHRDLA